MRRLFPQISLAGVFVIAALIAFLINLNSYFLSDDFAQIGKVLHGDYSFTWGQAQGGFFRPLFILSYIIDGRVWHYRPFGYHLTNIFLHGLNSFFVFNLGQLLLARVKLPGRSIRAGAAAAAAFFLVHPSHTEAVIWISGRADLLATCFLLISLWRYCEYVDKPTKFNLLFTIIPGVAALLSKESAICLPFLILALGIYLSRGKKVVVEFGLFALLLIVYILGRAAALGSFVGGYGTGQHLNFAPGWIRDRVLEAIIRSTLPTLPESWSSFLYKPLQSPMFFVVAAACVGLLALALIVRARGYGLAEKRTQNRFIILLIVLFFVSLLPAINLRLSLYQSLGERFLYLPSVFVCLLISYGFLVLFRRPRTWAVVVIILLGLYSWRLYSANQLWRQASLLTHSLAGDLGTSSSTNQLTIVNAPDNLGGVPVFHNGLPEALQLFPRAQRFEQVEINAFQTLQSATDTNEMKTAGELVTIQPANQRNIFDRPAAAGCLRLIDHTATALQFSSQSCLDKSGIYYFSAGKMMKVFE